MKIFIEFILDFWRELVFGFLILACVFLTLGFRSRGADIASLQSEVTQLRSGQSSVVTTDQESTKEDLESSNNKDELAVDTVETNDEDEFVGFDFTEGSSWTFSEGDDKIGYTFTNGTRTVDVIPNPANLVVSADINWLFDVSEDAETKSRILNVTDDNENFCVAGQENCTFGDGRLQVLVNQNSNNESVSEIQFFYTDTAYSPGGDSFTSLKDFISLITLN